MNKHYYRYAFFVTVFGVFLLMGGLLIMRGYPAHAATPNACVGPTIATATTCFPTIEAALLAANTDDYVVVSAGFFTPSSTIIIDKNGIKLRGAQADNDPRPSKGTARVAGDTSTESIVDGSGILATIIRIAADNVSINGFEIRNGTGDLIDSTSRPIAYIGPDVRNNIIHNSTGDEGIQLRSTEAAVISRNNIFNTFGDGINICCGSARGVITDNEVHDIDSENAAIYVYDATSTKIKDNLVYNTTKNDGIKLGDKTGDDAGKEGGVIIGNVIYNTAQDGISVYMSNVIVQCNDVSGSTSENGAVYLDFGIVNITMVDNTIHDNELATSRRPNAAGIFISNDVDGGTVTITNNNIFNNTPYDASSEATDAIDARSNWWGDMNDPASNLSGAFDYSPWLTSAVTPPCQAAVTDDTRYVDTRVCKIKADYVFTFPQVNICAKNIGSCSAKQGPYNLKFTLPAGDYSVTLQSYDQHTGKNGTGSQGQKHEEYFVELKNTQGVTGNSYPISDLPNKRNGMIQTVNGILNPMRLTATSGKISAISTKMGDSANSISPICVGLSRLP